MDNIIYLFFVVDSSPESFPKKKNACNKENLLNCKRDQKKNKSLEWDY